MTTRNIDLVYFDGCPNAQQARENLHSALESLGEPPHWDEWDLASEATPARYRAHGSPTILVGGVDVMHAGAGAAAMACRSDGAPSVSTIVEHLR